MHGLGLGLVPSLAGGLLGGCGGRDAAARFRRAQRLWRERPDFAAGYGDWLALPPESPEGQQARRRLQEAAVHYQRAIELIRHDRPGAREALSDGKRLAPMDPALYLPLARACRDQGIYIRAVDYYRSFLVHRPGAAEAAAARAELHAVDADATVPARGEDPDEDRRLRWLLPLGLASVLGLGAVPLLLRLRRPPTLAALALASPELQPTLTYLIGRLRHELLKHRIGAVTDALSALDAGESTAAQRLFLADRIFGGEPLLQVWREHLVGFERALGPQKHVLAADPGFRAAGSALAELLRLRAGFLLGQRRALRRMVALHEALRRFDTALGRLSRRLSRTAIDRPLLESVLAEVRGEYSARQVELDEVRLLLGPEPAATPGAPSAPSGPTAPPVVVEVYRVDLLLVLRNLLRNAILAVGRAAPPRRIGVALSLALLPTGEESVQVHVLDSSPEPLSTADLYAHSGAPGQRAQRGLGLVIAALGLYNGSITVERIGELAARAALAGPAGPIAPAALAGFEKAVTVHLFRALGSTDDDDDDDKSEAGGDCGVGA